MPGVTDHWIKRNIEMNSISITLAFEPIERPHTVSNIAILLNHILDKFNLTRHLYSITANNASNNTTTGQHLHINIPQLNTTNNLNGCVAHIINLISKAGMAVFDQNPPPTLVDALDPNIPNQDSTTPIFIESTPHSGVRSILTRIQYLHKQVKHSSQLIMALEDTILDCPKLDCKTGVVYKVSTCWLKFFFNQGKLFLQAPATDQLCLVV